tara:strand:+ start:208 stop:1092 length:885 start_codon:yes stop_codon:yes gene_type:complete
MKFYINLLLISLFINVTAYAAKVPNVPKDIDADTYCVDAKNKFDVPFENVTVLIDKTTQLHPEQVKWIKNNIFQEKTVTEFPPFTKFSVLLIDHRAAQLQEYIFNKCRPKTGIDNTDFDYDEYSWFENQNILKSEFQSFLEDFSLVGEMLDTNESANNTYIIETLMEVFDTRTFDFSSDDYSKRTLIIVSDMMQHTDNISFYRECLEFLKECSSFDTLLKNKQTKDYIDDRKLRDVENLDVKLFLLSFRCETSEKHQKSLVNLWRKYFEYNDIEIPANDQDWVNSQKYFTQTCS